MAVLGLNDATETTGYVMPAGILRRAGLADVLLLATRPGPVALYPALAVQPDATSAEFGARYPHGADDVIVPAMSRNGDPAALGFLKRQAAAGATVIGVCAGACSPAGASSRPASSRRSSTTPAAGSDPGYGRRCTWRSNR